MGVQPDDTREVLQKWVEVSRRGAQFPHTGSACGWICCLWTPPEAIQTCARACQNTGKRHLKGNEDTFPSCRAMLLCPQRDLSWSKGKRPEGIQLACSHYHQLPKQQAGLTVHGPVMRVIQGQTLSAWHHASPRPHPCSFNHPQVPHFSSLWLFT